MIRLTYLIVATIISAASYSNAMNAYHDDECFSIRPMFLSISELMSESQKYGKELQSIEMRIKGDPVFGDEPEMPNAEDLRKAHWLLSWLKEKEKYIEDNYRDKCASSRISGADYQDVKTSVSAAIKLVHQWIKSASKESTRQWVENTNLPVFTQNDKDMVEIPSPQELLDSLLGDKNVRLAFNPNQKNNAANEVEQKIKNVDICLKAIAHLSSNSGVTNQATEYSGVVRINQTRGSDKKQFLYDCKIIGNRISWRMSQP